MHGEAFWQGYDARLKGETVEACPYPPETTKAVAWLEGWSDKSVAALDEAVERAK